MNYDIEDVQAALIRINALVNLMREYAEPLAAKQNEFSVLALNLLNVHELVYQLETTTGNLAKSIL